MPVKTQHVIDKFCESSWKLSVYGTLLSLGVHALHDQPWLTESANFWRHWPVEALPCATPLSTHCPVLFWCLFTRPMHLLAQSCLTCVRPARNAYLTCFFYC